MRVRLFIDFWNFQLGWNEYHRKKGVPHTLKIPWATKLPAVVCSALGEDALYAGTHVYASTDPKNPNDSGLRKFLNVLDGFPGYSVVVKDRRPASKIRCPECKQEVEICPHCGRGLRGTVEKGIDTSLVTDLLTKSLDGLHDRAVLISADSDMIPAVEYLQDHGRNVTHLYFRPLGAALRNACWDHIYFDDLMDKLLSAE